jgi:heterodisulfide reductase subunit C
MSQIIFSALLAITIVAFAFSAFKIYKLFKLTKPAYPVKDFGKRIKLTIVNAFFQERIFRKPIAGIMHALVFWGFCSIIFGSIEMVIDGIAGTDRVLSFAGIIYDIVMAAGDLSAYIIALFIVIFIIRRTVLDIKRLHGKELTKRNHADAILALTFIFILMITLAGMNIFYIAGDSNYVGLYPISALIAPIFNSLSSDTIELLHNINWWGHIVLIFIFANILPYSKHFHIFMSIPNVFFSRLTPLGKMTNMDSITKEVKLMMNPETAYAAAPEDDAAPARFGVLDIEDVTWKNFIDSLACTQCGRCTSVCPANITGKELSPRKMIIDIRRRMKDKGNHILKEGKDYTDGKTLIRDYISTEEIWACTTCNACAKECPLNIDHPTFILDMRRYLVMEEASAPSQLNAIFSNIENNGAPWQYSNQDRLKWTE